MALRPIRQSDGPIVHLAAGEMRRARLACWTRDNTKALPERLVSAADLPN
jgi:hypothetical protein